MNPEYRVYAAQLVIDPPEHTAAKPEEATFTLNFNLDGIDESFFFDENQEEQEEVSQPEVQAEGTEKKKESKPLEPDKQSTLFSEWLQSTMPDEAVAETELPKVFQQAEKKGKKVADQLKGVSAAGLGSVGSVFSSLSSIIGACGPICAHTLGALGNAGSSLGSAGVGFSGLNMPGFSVDKNGNFSLSGNVDSLANSLGISQADLLSGKYSSQDILYRLFSTFGEGIGLIFGFGLVEMLIDCLFDSFLPTGSGTIETPMAA